MSTEVEIEAVEIELSSDTAYKNDGMLSDIGKGLVGVIGDVNK